MNKILLIHCGGTLAMVKCLHGYTTQKGNLRNFIFSNPKIAKKTFCLKETNCGNCTRNCAEIDTFITPYLVNDIVAKVDIFEFPEILDSSNASVKEWCEVAEVMNHFYDNYDGFIIVHGTDTMTYATSFLCFMIEGLNLPVIVTGSTLPAFVEGSDAEANLIGAIQSCVLVGCPGVYLFFNGWLHHGARVTKISSEAYDGIFSTNPIKITDLAKDFLTKQKPKSQQEARPFFHTDLSRDVGLLKIHPNIHPVHFKAALDVYKAVILETYGTGTFPFNRKELLGMIKTYIKNGGVVVNVSQCADGNVTGIYESNDILSRIGVVSAKNMTTEAAFAKLSLLLANKPDKVVEWFGMSFCGEIDEEANTKLYNFNTYTNTMLL